MARIIECKKLSYNWHEIAVGNVKETVVDVYEVGKDGVGEIIKRDDLHYDVFFDDGRVIELHNPNKAEFFPVKNERP